MIYGYVRVSTASQTVANQKFAIENYCSAHNLKVDKWFSETVSSRVDLKDRELNRLLQRLKAGDILLASELSRIGRNMLEVMGILQQCLKTGCQVWTLKENYRLGEDIQSKVLAFAFSLISETERQFISCRTKESLSRLKAAGKHLGRPFGRKNAFYELRANRDRILSLAEQKVPKAKIARMFKVDRGTIRRFIEQNKPSDATVERSFI